MTTKTDLDKLAHQSEEVAHFLAEEARSRQQELCQWAIMYCQRRDWTGKSFKALLRSGAIKVNQPQHKIHKRYRMLSEHRAVIDELEKGSKLRRRKQRFFELLFNIRPCKECAHADNHHGGKKYRAYDELKGLAEKLLGPLWTNRKPHLLKYEEKKHQ